MSEPQRFIEPPTYFRQVKTFGEAWYQNEPLDDGRNYGPETGRWEQLQREGLELENQKVRTFWLIQFLAAGTTIEKHNPYGHHPLKQDNRFRLWCTGLKR